MVIDDNGRGDLYSTGGTSYLRLRRYTTTDTGDNFLIGYNYFISLLEPHPAIPYAQDIQIV